MARTEYGTTWWGQQWLKALSGIDYDNRIPRGKTYANTGRVQSFKIDESKHIVKARVTGNFDPFYSVKLGLPQISPRDVKRLVDAIAASPLVLAKLSARELSPDVLQIADRLGIKIFPSRWSDLEMTCSCPDWAVPCKHIAAVIYKMSEEIDANPFVLFTLRGIDLIGELEKRGIGLGRSQEAEMPKWRDLLGDSLGKLEDPDLPPSDEDWLQMLRDVSFNTVADQREALHELLSETPAGYVHGSLRETLTQVVKIASRLAKEQMKEGCERTVPTYDPASPLVCINSWGQTLMDPSLVWTEQNRETGEFDPVRLKTRDNPKGCARHQMFSGFFNTKRLATAPQELEALYYAWLIAARLVLNGAVIPQIYEPIDDHFAVRWIPAVMAEDVRVIVSKVGQAFSHVSNAFLQIARRPRSIPPLQLGQIVLGIFVQSFIESAFADLLERKNLAGIIELQALFAGRAVDCEDNEQAQAARMRLEAWISPLFTGSTRVRPVLIVHDYMSDPEGEKLDAATARAMPVGISLGFTVNDAGVADDDAIPLQKVLTEDEHFPIRFDCMRTVARLSQYCSELADIVRREVDSIRLPLKDLAELLFKSLPALRLLGVTVIVPRSLRSLLTPSMTLAVDLEEDKWDQASGFLGLQSLLSFNWEIAVGERPISRKEFAELCKHAGEVVWFHDRYMFVSQSEIATIQRRLEEKASAISKAELVRAALSGNFRKSGVVLGDALKKALKELFAERPLPLPSELNATLRPYQERGYRWMLRNLQASIGSIIADDMGLGKTLQVLAVLERLREQGELDLKPALIVVPTSLLMNWIKEAAKFAPKLRIAPFYGTGRSIEQCSGSHAILTTYGTLRSSVKDLALSRYRVMVIDEAQAIKNFTTSSFRAVRTIKCDGFIAMSGTPVENRLMEYWSIMEATNPGLLGSAARFRTDVAFPIENQRDAQAAERFRKLTAPFIMRRMKTDKAIISDLPDKITSDEYCTLTKEQIALYQTVVAKAMGSIEKETDKFNKRALVLQLIMRLKQVCNAPAQFEKETKLASPEYSGKMQRLFDILDEMREADRKVLIFTQFTQMGELLRKWIGGHSGVVPPFLHGGCSIKEREELVQQFQTRRDTPVMILSLKAAGTGLNLTAASAVVHYDLWWNPAVEDQATDRAYRIGQKSNVNVYRLISADTFEEKIDAMIKSKKDLAQMTVATGESWIGDLSNKELREVFSLSEPARPALSQAAAN